MTTTVELSIAGRGASDAPLLSDLIEHLRDLFEMVGGVAASIANTEAEPFDWQVVGLSKNSPARVTVEAIPRPGHSNVDDLAAQARDMTARGLRELQEGVARPLHFDDNVIEAAQRFARRAAYSLTKTQVGDGVAPLVEMGSVAASMILTNIEAVREDDPVHPYREIGSFEGYVKNAGKDGYGKPYVIITNRLNDKDVKCFLSGEALRVFGEGKVKGVVWRERRVTAVGVLRYRSAGRLTHAEINRLDFADPDEQLPSLEDILDPDFTGGLRSEEYLERLRNGDA